MSEENKVEESVNVEPTHDQIREAFLNAELNSAPEMDNSRSAFEDKLKEAVKGEGDPAAPETEEKNSFEEILAKKNTEEEKPSENSEQLQENDEKLVEKEAPEQVIEFKVNGKLESLTLDEIKEKYPKVLERLKNEVSGEKEIARRFTELDKREKSVYNTIREFKDYLGAFDKKAKDGDIVGAISYLGQLAGTAPHIVKEQLVAALTPEVLRRQHVSRDEIDYELQLEDLEYNKRLQESKAKQLAAEQAAYQAELRAAKLNSLRETHGIDEQTWNEAFSELDREVPQGEPVTPQMVIDRAKQSTAQRQSVSWATEIAKQENLSLSDFEELKAVALQYPQFSKDDLVSLIKEAKEEVLKETSKKNVEMKLEQKLSRDPKLSEEEEHRKLRALFGR